MPMTHLPPLFFLLSGSFSCITVADKMRPLDPEEKKNDESRGRPYMEAIQQALDKQVWANALHEMGITYTHPVTKEAIHELYEDSEEDATDEDATIEDESEKTDEEDENEEKLPKDASPAPTSSSSRARRTRSASAVASGPGSPHTGASLSSTRETSATKPVMRSKIPSTSSKSRSATPGKATTPTNTGSPSKKAQNTPSPDSDIKTDTDQSDTQNHESPASPVISLTPPPPPVVPRKRPALAELVKSPDQRRALKDAANEPPEHERLYLNMLDIRHQIQRIVYAKADDNLSEQDFDVLNRCLTRAEQLTPMMTKEMLQSSQLYGVIKYTKNMLPKELPLCVRAIALAELWRTKYDVHTIHRPRPPTAPITLDDSSASTETGEEQQAQLAPAKSRPRAKKPSPSTSRAPRASRRKDNLGPLFKFAISTPRRIAPTPGVSSSGQMPPFNIYAPSVHHTADDIRLIKAYPYYYSDPYLSNLVPTSIR
ncbi:hypothetical protein BC940DRAFT_306210 [Gongronella butleri]|nr:hypothetical protein BC940DRAFT_306210 [Gongronella butleri]